MAGIWPYTLVGSGDVRDGMASQDGVAYPLSGLDSFLNAIAAVRRREILDTLMAGEKAVGAIVADLSLSQPQVSKHLRVLSEVGLVKCRAQGRHRLYSLEPARLRPLHEGLARYEQMWNERLDRMDDYLTELQGREAAVRPSRHGSAHIEFPNELDVLITREFDAPIALVFDVLTKPEHVSKWGATPPGPDEGVLDRPARRRELPLRLRD